MLKTNFWVVIAAGGSGTRCSKGVAKQFLSILGKPIISYSMELFFSHPRINNIMIAARDKGEIDNIANGKSYHYCNSGNTRSETVHNALQEIYHLDKTNPFVLVHDAARPCLSHRDLSNLINTLEENPNQAAILAKNATDSIKVSKDNDKCDLVSSSLDRDYVWSALTPQGARLNYLLDAMSDYKNNPATDEACYLERLGKCVNLVSCQDTNIKVTWQEDLFIAEAVLKLR